jgi:hypothetical protein
MPTDVLTKPLEGILHRSLDDPILLGDGVPAIFKKGIVEIGEIYEVGIFGALWRLENDTKLEFLED